MTDCKEYGADASTAWRRRDLIRDRGSRARRGSPPTDSMAHAGSKCGACRLGCKMLNRTAAAQAAGCARRRIAGFAAVCGRTAVRVAPLEPPGLVTGPRLKAAAAGDAVGGREQARSALDSVPPILTRSCLNAGPNRPAGPGDAGPATLSGSGPLDPGPLPRSAATTPGACEPRRGAATPLRAACPLRRGFTASDRPQAR